MTIASLVHGPCRSAAIIIAFTLLLAATLRAEPLVKANDRLAFCGDAMTADLGYTVYIEDYLLSCPPVPGLVTAEFGWCAQTPAGFAARLGQDVAPFRPSVVTIFFNYSNAGKPLDAAAAQARQKAQTDLIQAIKRMGVATIVLGSPACVGPGPQIDATKAEAFNNNLAQVAEIDRAVAGAQGVVFADVFGATSAAVANAKTKFGPSYVVDADGRSLAIAYAFLKALGCQGNIGTITARFTPDFHIRDAQASAGHQILSIKDQTLKAQSAHFAFCFPGYPSGKPVPDPFAACVPFHAELNRFLLVVKDLPTPAAKIYWNDRWQDYSADELARGVNLAADLPSAFPSFQNMDNAVRNQLQDQRIAGSATLEGKPDPKTAADAEQSLQRAKDCVVPTQYALRIQPLAATRPRPSGPVNVIVDTDMSSDCDDAGALALVNDFMCLGEANLIACNVNMHDAAKSSGAAVQAINAYYGHPNIPIGACYDPEPSCGSAYTAVIHKRFDPDFPNDDQLPRGVDVYRKALASSADHSVVICSLGWMENITDLLKSAPDAASPLSGPELVKQKVKQLVVMANTNPNDIWIVKNWPTEIIWTTDVGNYVYPGKSLTTTPDNNPVRQIYKLNGAEGGRQGWDLTAAWLAVRGPGEVYALITGGHWQVNTPPAEYGTWMNGPPTNQTMATVKTSPETDRRRPRPTAETLTPRVEPPLATL